MGLRRGQQGWPAACSPTQGPFAPGVSFPPPAMELALGDTRLSPRGPPRRRRQRGMAVKGPGQAPGRAALVHSLSRRMLFSFLIPLCLSFLICKVGVVTP